MSSIAMVLGFSWNYLRRYWGRLVASVLFGLTFALSNASFIWATRTLVGRFDSAPTVLAPRATPTRSLLSQQLTGLQNLNARIEQALDPWLPRAGQPGNWRQVVGLLGLLSLLVTVRATSDYLNNYCMGW